MGYYRSSCLSTCATAPCSSVCLSSCCSSTSSSTTPSSESANCASRSCGALPCSQLRQECRTKDDWTAGKVESEKEWVEKVEAALNSRLFSNWWIEAAVPELRRAGLTDREMLKMMNTQKMWQWEERGRMAWVAGLLMQTKNKTGQT